MNKKAFYRHARLWHGWLSALAFLMLMFFAATGLLLNHPDWFESAAQEQTQTLPLPAPLKAQMAKMENPSDAILAYVRGKQSLTGRFQSSEVNNGEVMIRLQSPVGQTDVWVSALDDQIEITQKPASVVQMMNDLHRGKNTGAAWRLWMDVCSVVVMVLSLAGYALFLQQRKRLARHLGLTAASVVLLIGMVWWSV